MKKKYIIIDIKNYNNFNLKKLFYFINNYYNKKKIYILNNKIKLIIILKNINTIINLKYNILNYIYKLNNKYIYFIIK